MARALADHPRALEFLNVFLENRHWNILNAAYEREDSRSRNLFFGHIGSYTVLPDGKKRYLNYQLNVTLSVPYAYRAVCIRMAAANPDLDVAHIIDTMLKARANGSEEASIDELLLNFLDGFYLPRVVEANEGSYDVFTEWGLQLGPDDEEPTEFGYASVMMEDLPANLEAMPAWLHLDSVETVHQWFQAWYQHMLVNPNNTVELMQLYVESVASIEDPNRAVLVPIGDFKEPERSISRLPSASGRPRVQLPPLPPPTVKRFDVSQEIVRQQLRDNPAAKLILSPYKDTAFGLSNFLEPLYIKMFTEGIQTQLYEDYLRAQLVEWGIDVKPCVDRFLKQAEKDLDLPANVAGIVLGYMGQSIIGAVPGTTPV